ncbi:MAG: hypothetical protein H0V88_05640 [Pyrinomonadaceae bacterium]|nr:hypothetical protein [Pyrinomonadaceae bacterium]
MKLSLVVILLSTFQFVSAQTSNPALTKVDRIRLAEAFRIGDELGDRVWKHWRNAPFAVLLVTPEYEFLIRHPQPSADFSPLGYDRTLKSNVFFRKRTQRTDLLAAMPAIKGSSISTIVVGTAENTSARASTPWVVSLLHEHFHQLQSSQSNYYAEVNGLNLSRGDQSGMWMLNFAFPYRSAEVQERFAALSRLLLDTLEASGQANFSNQLAAYLEARRAFEQTLSPDDYRYFSFQLWQEGIARYTEYKIAQLASAQYKPAAKFRALEDFTLFEQAARATRERIYDQLRTMKLGDAGRTAFYPFGAAEGLLLDRINPRWRERYFVEKFDLGRYLRAANSSRRGRGE